jgi:hypothetical protein
MKILANGMNYIKIYINNIEITLEYDCEMQYFHVYNNVDDDEIAVQQDNCNFSILK